MDPNADLAVETWNSLCRSERRVEKLKMLLNIRCRILGCY